MCQCDKPNGYLCFECEQYVAGEVKDLLHRYKYEIAKDGDWWYGLPDYSINVFCYDEGGWEKPDALFEINVYRVGENGMDDYSIQWDLPPLTRQELLAS